MKPSVIFKSSCGMSDDRQIMSSWNICHFN